LSALAATIAAVLGVTLVLKGVSSLGGADTQPSVAASTHESADADGQAPPDGESNDGPGPATASVPPQALPPQAVPPQPTPTIACAEIIGGDSADVDGDGCEEGIVIDGGTVQVEQKRYQIGEPGDAVTVVDWDCDGEAAPAVLRPATGEVFVFDRWATADEDVTATLIGEAPGAVALDVGVEGGCPVLVPRDKYGAPIALGEAD